MAVMRKPHLKSLTGLRFFAAIYIVLFHHGQSALASFPGYIYRLSKYGYISVSLFFVLSGFVLAYIYLDCKEEPSLELGRFGVARFARIYPLYLFALIVSLPALVTRFSELGSIRFFAIVVSAISLVQAWTPWTAAIWNTPLWAVSVEAFCYFLFPFLAIRINRLASRIILLAIIILWILALIMPVSHVLGLSGWMTFIIYAPIFHIPQFLIGVCTGILFLREIENPSNNQMYSKVSVFAVISFISMFSLLLRFDIPYELLNNGLFSPLFSVIIFALSFERGFVSKLLSIPLLITLGEISYATYLLQNPTLSFLKKVCEKGVELGLVSSSFFGSFPFLLSYLLILIGVSFCAFSLIETPLRNILIIMLNKQPPNKSNTDDR